MPELPETSFFSPKRKRTDKDRFGRICFICLKVFRVTNEIFDTCICEPENVLLSWANKNNKPALILPTFEHI